MAAQELPTTTVSSASGGPPAPPSRVRALLSRVSDSWQHAVSQSRPWRELVDRSSFSKPDSLADAGSRIRKNLAHFRLNYALLLTAVLALTLITHPFSLFLIGALFAAWMYGYLVRTTPLVLFSRTYSEREVFIILSLFSVVVLFMTSVGSVLVSAAMLGLAIICIHGAFHVPDDLFLDDEVPASSSFLPFLNTGSAQPSVVPVRV